MSLLRINPVARGAQLDQFASPQFISYSSALSKVLIQSQIVRDYPDLIALGYWLRPAKIKRIVSAYQHLHLRPVGHVFHAAPGNVDCLFVYVGIISLMCGNINTVKLSNKAGRSAELLCDIIKSLTDDHPEVSARFQLVRSERDNSELIALQQSIDARVLWGSNEGIQALRKIAMPSHARELVFAHKLSFAVLGIDAVLSADKNELKKLCENFARDNLTFAQQACSSAKVLVWQGKTERLSAAQKRFWQNFDSVVGVKFANQQLEALSESEYYQALNNAQYMAMAGWVSQLDTSGVVCRAWSDSLNKAFTEHHRGAGLFIETQVETLSALNQFLTPSHQTMTYWGVSSVDEWLKQCLTGVDRVVPVGEALDFNVVWDGLDLVRALGRVSERSFNSYNCKITPKN